jgi:RNA polymerase sigma factor (sigma-70 family)
MNRLLESGLNPLRGPSAAPAALTYMVVRTVWDDKIGATCHMDTVLPALISSDTRPRTHAMEQCELERELGQLHSESWGWALACCRRDRDLAEDVLQSAYLRILSRRAKFNGDSSFKTWVFGVIRWTARGEVRRRLFWNRRHSDSVTAIDFTDSASRADTGIEEWEKRTQLIHALDSLSRRQREVLRKKALARQLAPEGR